MTFEELRKELNEKLRSRVYKCNFLASLFVLLSEVIVFYFFYASEMIDDVRLYLRLRILIPSLLSFGSLFLFRFLITRKKFSEFSNNLFSVLSVYVLCSTVAVFHNYYSMILLAMIVPVLMSAAFGDRRILLLITVMTVPVAAVAYYLNYNERSISFGSMYRLANLITCSCFLIAGYILARSFLKMQQIQMNYLRFSNQNEKELIERLHIDPLTELNNRTGLKEILAEAIKKFTFENVIYYLVMVDVDHFKIINDTYGHLKGDIVLKKLAHIIKAHLIEGESAFRFGGEEFLLLLKAKPEDSFEVVYDEIKSIGTEFCETEYDFCPGQKITFSAGLCSCEYVHEVDEWIKWADEAMYTSKIEGRNRITVHRPKQ